MALLYATPAWWQFVCYSVQDNIVELPGLCVFTMSYRILITGLDKCDGAPLGMDLNCMTCSLKDWEYPYAWCFEQWSRSDILAWDAQLGSMHIWLNGEMVRCVFFFSFFLFFFFFFFFFYYLTTHYLTWCSRAGECRGMQRSSSCYSNHVVNTFRVCNLLWQ